ncbi:MAG: hypothetical protein NZT92_22105 [Abditibacteriales bacterium]|nr:hypothetical protein [Abditibacteriales bacterium]MDW8367851.1 hypothetical protein [Abditibacteriales bacterium]
MVTRLLRFAFSSQMPVVASEVFRPDLCEGLKIDLRAIDERARFVAARRISS